MALSQEIEPALCKIELQTVAVKGIDTKNQLDADSKIGEFDYASRE